MRTKSKRYSWAVFFVLSLLFMSACNPEEKDMEDDYDRNYPESKTYSKTIW